MTTLKNIKWPRLLLEGLAILLTIIFFFPIVMIILNAAKETASAVTSNPLGLPENWSALYENIKAVWTSENTHYQQAFISSLIVTVGSLAAIVITSSMAGWALSRNKSRLSNIIFLMFVVAMIIPFQVVMLPLVSWFRKVYEVTDFKLLRTYYGMILAYVGFGAPLSIFLYHGFVKSIPKELEEAAEIDGCNKLQTFLLIVLPILKPITVTILILNGIWIWNDFLLPLLILGKGSDLQTVPLAIANYAGAFVTEWQFLLSAVLMAMFPVFVLFLFAQKYIIKGMVAGSVK